MLSIKKHYINFFDAVLIQMAPSKKLMTIGFNQ